MEYGGESGWGGHWPSVGGWAQDGAATWELSAWPPLPMIAWGLGAYATVPRNVLEVRISTGDKATEWAWGTELTDPKPQTTVLTF